MDRRHDWTDQPVDHRMQMGIGYPEFTIFVTRTPDGYTPRYIGKPDRLPYRQQASMLHFVHGFVVHGGWIVV